VKGARLTVWTRRAEDFQAASFNSTPVTNAMEIFQAPFALSSLMLITSTD
jgi:hypothetical protein